MIENRDKQMKELLEGHKDSIQTPASLEDDIMQNIALVETKKYAYINMKKVFVFAGLVAVLVLLALAAQFYFPEAIWLVQAKLTVACILVIFILYQVVTWLPSLTEKLFKKVN
jgi:hypothetical protein